MQSNFLLGELRLTDSARMTLKRLPYDLVCRHAVNEHGLISDVERNLNERGMQTLGPIISRYKADPTDPRPPTVVVYTRATWDETLIYIQE